MNGVATDVFFLTAGLLRAPAFLLAQRGAAGSEPRPFDRVPLSNTVAVLRHGLDDVTLVDCGWSEEVCANPRKLLGVRAFTVGIDVRAGEAIVTQLEGFGIHRTAVRRIVATHLHFDHVGGARDFPNAEILTTDDELRAHRKLGRRGGYDADDLARSGRVRCLPLGDGPCLGFSRSHDLFGDGSVRVMPAPGHTLGGLAVFLAPTAFEEPYLLVGDSLLRQWEGEQAWEAPSPLSRMLAADGAAHRETRARIHASATSAAQPLVVPSHDVDVFASLRHSPGRH